VTSMQDSQSKTNTLPFPITSQEKRLLKHFKMTDVKEPTVEVAAAVEVVEVKEMNVLEALQQVLKNALIHDGLSRGLHE